MRLLSVISLFFIFVACNKEKHYSTKLMKGEVWKVSEVNINGTNQTNIGEWNIQQDISIYDSVPQLRWQQDGMDAQCEWQFQEKGKKFALNYIQLCEECDGEQLDTLDYMAYNLSGTYNVVKHSRKKMQFETKEARGYIGSIVKIFLVRKK